MQKIMKKNVCVAQPDTEMDWLIPTRLESILGIMAMDIQPLKWIECSGRSTWWCGDDNLRNGHNDYIAG